MNYTISNEKTTITVSEFGAELQSIRSSDGIEYLWQGNSKYWINRAPVLFPYVGRLTEKRYIMDEQSYSLEIHGFASKMYFALSKANKNSLSFKLTSSEKTLIQYPRNFIFQVVYTLYENRIIIQYLVTNCDEKEMYFGLGGHPGFNVPIRQDLQFEDYYLSFFNSSTIMRVSFNNSCFVNGNETVFLLTKNGELPLTHSLFNHDAIVLKGTGNAVSLKCHKDHHSITVRYPQMPYLGIWHKPMTDAPYVCLEPWSSLPAFQNEITVFEKQKDLIRLLPKQHYKNHWEISVF